jgi:hypothetical protein
MTTYFSASMMHWVVVVEYTDTNINQILNFARPIGASYYKDGHKWFAVVFSDYLRIRSEPRVYTERQLRRILRRRQPTYIGN